MTDKPTTPITGTPTKRISFLNLNWDILDSRDILSIITGSTSSTACIVRIYRTRFGRGEGNYTEKFKEKKETLKERIKRKKKAFMAVAEFENIEDAIEVYKKLDGSELEYSNMFLDLRFVPEDVELEGVEEECRELGDYVMRGIEVDTEIFNDEDVEGKKRRMEIDRLFREDDYETDLVDISEEETNSKNGVSTEGNLTRPVSREVLTVTRPVSREVLTVTPCPSTQSAHPTNQTSNTSVMDNFKFNKSDDRFKCVYEDDDFVIDPSHPEYKKRPGLKKIVEERRKKYKEEDGEEEV